MGVMHHAVTQLKIRLPSRSMPKMKNLNQSIVFMNAIVDPNRRVNQHPDASTVCYRTTQAGIAPQ